MSDGADPAHQTPAPTDWQRPALWVVLTLGLVLLLASLTGQGSGMFGWGFMMGTMWLWMLLPVLFLVAAVVLVLQFQARRGMP